MNGARLARQCLPMFNRPPLMGNSIGRLMMTVRHVIGFENNQQAMECLNKQWSERRKIDKELGVKGTVRYFVASFFGPNSGTMSIQYEYADLAGVQRANELRNGNARWNQLNQELNATGMKLTISGIATELTPG